MTQLLEDDQLRQRLGEQGRETVREQFLTPRLVDDFLTLLADVAGADRTG
ncbi:trehalose synthase [Halogranum amylolyticum]|uniref:Trehalose synthase n=1 Tax=Halogranum amylolyticum TaxID=660520 RepID=A0A1H8V639_9EURY|nr:trehalose synthase [Halogranum amylolyticum]